MPIANDRWTDLIPNHTTGMILIRLATIGLAVATGGILYLPSSIATPTATIQRPVEEPPDRPEEVGSIVEVDESPELVIIAHQTYQSHGSVLIDGDGVAWRPMTVTTTAYVPTADQCDADPDVTATGTDAYTTYGVAADPRVLPYGTVVRVPGYGDVTVDDTGSAMRRQWRRHHRVQLDLRIPFQRLDGTTRSEAECERIAVAHGVQHHQTILVQVH